LLSIIGYSGGCVVPMWFNHSFILTAPFSSQHHWSSLLWTWATCDERHVSFTQYFFAIQ